MANDLTTTNSNTAVAVAGGNPFLDAGEAIGGSSSVLFVRFDGNVGEFSFGKDREEIPAGARMAINPNEFRKGWVCWSGGKVMEEVMVRITEGKPPVKGSLTDYGPYDDEQDGWKEQVSLQMRDIETGDEYQFKTFSAGGRIAVGNLLTSYGKNFMRNPGKLAIVELGAQSFEVKDKKNPNKKYKKFAPQFTIVDWQDEDELIAKFDAQAAEDAPEAEDDDLPVNNAGRRGRKF